MSKKTVASKNTNIAETLTDKIDFFTPNEEMVSGVAKGNKTTVMPKT